MVTGLFSERPSMSRMWIIIMNYSLNIITMLLTFCHVSVGRHCTVILPKGQGAMLQTVAG